MVKLDRIYTRGGDAGEILIDRHRMVLRKRAVGHRKQGNTRLPSPEKFSVDGQGFVRVLNSHMPTLAGSGENPEQKKIASLDAGVIPW